MPAPQLRTSLIRLSLAVLALCGVMTGQTQARVFIGLGVPLFFPPVVMPTTGLLSPVLRTAGG